MIKKKNKQDGGGVGGREGREGRETGKLGTLMLIQCNGWINSYVF